MSPHTSKIADSKEHLQRLLADWTAREWLRPLDSAFAEFLWREVPDAPPLLILAAALASYQLGRGHACLDLGATLEDPTFTLSLPPEGAAVTETPTQLPGEVLADVSIEQWQAALTHPALVGTGPGATPLVLVGARLYLRRYWQYEQDVHHGIRHRLEISAELQSALPADDMRRTLDALFPRTKMPEQNQTTDWQKIACALAARSAFSIITGGPGTGKTTTVVKLLALLQSIALAAKVGDDLPPSPLRIRLAAPTGKAAARLNESIAGAVARLPLDRLAQGEDIRAAIPVKVTTLHRLLGSRPDTRHFNHHAGNLLALDVLVIDEASMVDLEMMAAVLAALPTKARLILLGDKDQLASVEAGAVLGALCQRAADDHYTPNTCDWLQDITGEMIDATLRDTHGASLDQAVVMLRHSHRFAADSGIGRLAEAVNASNTKAVEQIWAADHADLALLSISEKDDETFRTLIIDGSVAKATGENSVPSAEIQSVRCGYRHYLEAIRLNQPSRDADQAAIDAWAALVLKAHNQFQVLSALRSGPWGVEGLNQRIARLLHDAGLIPACEGWYAGRPVLVTRNDYGLGLMNGDIGITLAVPEGEGRKSGLRVGFPSGDGSQEIKWVLPNRLQSVETVYALTVHKSQGSEFTHAALVLPDTLNPILTRELIYTGITRAKNWLTVAYAGNLEIMEQAISRRVLRAGSLTATHEVECTVI